MTLYGFVLRSRAETLFRVMTSEGYVPFVAGFTTCERSDLLEHLLGEWSALAHRQVMRFAPGCSNGIPYLEVSV